MLRLLAIGAGAFAAAFGVLVSDGRSDAGTVSASSTTTVKCPAEAVGIAEDVRCGKVLLPLDRAKPAGQKIGIYFELYPRQDRSRPPISTVLSIEGGPGYATTPDRSARAEVWLPAAQRRDLLLVDLRGTGKSAALACQAFAKSTVGYAERGGRCARQIGAERDLYSTSQAVQDLEAVLRALDTGKIDLYGDSYGTYAAQAFALRYPERLRSLTLDGAYPLPGTDPATADLVAAGRRGLELACDRSPGCPAAARPDIVGLVARFADRVRARPIDGFAPDGDGTRTAVHFDVDALVQVFSSGYYFPSMWRELAAAILAAGQGDTAPILRLGAETVTVDAGGADPPTYSEALYLAVTCHDYPQLWDPATAIGDRQSEIDARLAAYPRGAFEPFTGAEWTGTDYEGWLACREWPSPLGADPPDPPGADYPDVPTLVLNGDLDTITASSQAREVASRFTESTFVELENSFHVTALYDRDDCASRIYVRFVKSLDPGDTSCARDIAEPHLVARFADRLSDVAAAQPAQGDASRVSDRRLAAAAAATVADVHARWIINYDGASVGLHGGTWSYTGDEPVVFSLDGVELVPGVVVSGTVDWSIDAGTIDARVTARADDGATAALRVSWSTRKTRATASLAGDVAGRRLAATMPAP